MPLRRYLGRGVSKTEPSRRFGVSRHTIYSWIASGDLDRDLAAGGISLVVGAAAIREATAGSETTSARSGRAIRSTREPLQDAAGPARPGGFREFRAAVGAAPRAAGGAQPFPDPVAAVLPPVDDGGADRRARERVRLLRRRTAGVAVRPDARRRAL